MEIHSDTTKTKSYAAYNKSEDIRLKSSSGGLFYAFAKRVTLDLVVMNANSEELREFQILPLLIFGK